MKGKSTHGQRYWEAQQMVQSCDDEATALVSIYFLCISILTPLDTGCEQWLGHKDNRKRYPLLLKKIDFSHIGSLARMQSIFSHFLIGPVSRSQFSCTLACTHALRTFFSSGFPCMHALLSHLDPCSHHCRLNSLACTHALYSDFFSRSHHSGLNSLAHMHAHMHFTWTFTHMALSSLS